MIAGATAIVAMVGVAACAKEKTAPTSTPTSTPQTTSPSLNPTQKAPRIPSGPNTFSPTVTAPPAPTATPGNH